MSNGVILFEPVAVANRLRPVLVRLNRHLRNELAALGITGLQATLLHEIKSRPGIGVGELAEAGGISAPAASGHVDRLEAAGLVRRTRSQDDRRRVGLELTEGGQRVLRSVRSRRTAWLAARLKELTPDEIAAIDGAIAPLSRLLEDDA